ncbi:putative protein kinase [Leptomonas pyrrhocoris]|uniref:non-specific serine/threonine protein kinase n=1 Tax=Leptomonas pyrrhocoris TaxID=157538 RepID=A0A0N0VCT4_LEPPY|nr:putative protein kinase [Leptomonas pyrrhocoris]KPA73778.1 putative protein kinase [Leptomonas pyrrhocoris]|eukprot:XP_015652217.1 putative protein kinase [Leptomonas pyrrhocoris]
MSAGSVRTGWRNGESSPVDAAAQNGSTNHSSPLHHSSPNSTAFHSFNTAPSPSSDPRTSTSSGDTQKQVSAHRFDWLQPWRTPQDCREGGLALLDSMHEILLNVQRARLSSVHAVYAPLHGSVGSASARLADTLDDSVNASFTLRLSMRSNRRRSRRATEAAAGAEEGEGDVSSNGDVNVVSTPGGATLIDYMLSGSRARLASHMWLDDATPLQPSTTTEVADEANGDNSKTNGDIHAQPSLNERAVAFLHTAAPPPPLPPQLLQQPTSQATTAAASVVEGSNCFALPDMLPSSPSAPGEAKAALHAPATDTVPPIPRFDELKVVQEALQQHQQAHQPPHPRSVAAQQQRRRAWGGHSSTEEEDDDEGGDPEDNAHEASHDGCPQATARPVPPPPPPPMLFPGNDAHHHDGDEHSSTSLNSPPGHEADRCASLSLTDVEAEEEEEDSIGDDLSDHMSATNFGEGGHLACVPGDTLHNRYSLLKALGVGRSSRVWLAADMEQCSLARRQLIRELGEREARRLFRPNERPMFVAIKVFRCGATYTDCATYEAKLSTFIQDSVRLRQLRALRSPPSNSFSLLVSPTSARHSRAGRSRANSNTSFTVSPPDAFISPGSTSNVLGISSASGFGHASASPTGSLLRQRLTTFRDAFAVEGAYGTHRCLVMDVLGSGVDKAINETHLSGFPSEVARAILRSTLQGLAVLAACNVIHTDLKPENLLFTDLEAEVAAEMRAFQSAQLQTGRRSGLWSSFTHRRESVLEYSQRREREGASSPLAAAGGLTGHSSSGLPSAATIHEEEENEALTSGVERSGRADEQPRRSSSRGGDFPHRTRPPRHEGAAEEDTAPLSPSQPQADPSSASMNNNGSSSGGSGGHHSTTAAVPTTTMTTTMNHEVGGRGGSPLVSSLLRVECRAGGGSAASSPPRARRPAYEVRVSDFGLSFITPPCLRLGVRAMARYTAEVGIAVDDLVQDDALSQLQWLYEQQQQLQRSQTRADGRRSPEAVMNHGNSPSSSSAGGGGGLEGWECDAAAVEGDLVNAAELRALQLEEAREDDRRLRRTCSVGEWADDAEAERTAAGGRMKEEEDTVVVELPDITAVEETPCSAKTKRGRPPPSAHATPDLDDRSSRSSSSSSANNGDAKGHRRVSADSSANSAMSDHFTAVAAAPSTALHTASYHSPVSRRLRASQRVASTSSSPPSPHRDKEQADEQQEEEEEVATEEHYVTSLTRPAEPRPPPLASFTATLSAAPAALSPSPPRRSPLSALASLTALRRLELDVVRNQRYTRGATVQSREYRAPEVVLGNFFLPSCDVWSIGCVAYELVTGRFLMDCTADREYFGRHVRTKEQGRIRAADGKGSNGPDEDDDDSAAWDEQPIYVDDPEQDLDVFHLKAMMRLLGPPPISFLHQHPMGLFVADFFDEKGDFKFWQRGEAEGCGMGLADAYRRDELRYWGSRRGPRGDRPAAAATVVTASTHAHSSDNTLDDDDDDAACDAAKEKGNARVQPGNSSQRLDPPSSAAPAVRADLGNPPPADTTPSALSMTPCSFATTTAAETAAGRGGEGESEGGDVPRRAFHPRTSVLDTRNYPMETPDWQEVRQMIRRTLTSAEEASDFENFLWRCLQWDPTHRATAAELLADAWMVKYSHKVANALDSDAEAEEGGADGQ